MNNKQILYPILALVGGGVLGYFLSTSGILGTTAAQEPEKDLPKAARIPCQDRFWTRIGNTLNRYGY